MGIVSVVGSSSYAMKPVNFSWIDGDHVAGMACPSNQKNIAWLKSNNVGLIVSLTEEPLGGRMLNCDGINVLHLPIPDFCAPTKDLVENFVKNVEITISQGKTAVVHCLGGRGRTGTLLACWLGRKLKISGEQAIKEIRMLRPGSVETIEQEHFVSEYLSSLAQVANLESKK